MLWLYPSMLIVFVVIIIMVEFFGFISEVFNIHPIKQWLLFGVFLIVVLSVLGAVI